ncbi:TonB-dependent siderophore receptor [Tolypothrix sp. VBCCA 56010]|uniref:TonB-dependent siderophore receptor n=1 Tax=Tolypothrix sp. VBCCA 56010 TaxID=3137731 RepID=UPI003D7C4743
MTITLTPKENRELWAEAKNNSQQNLTNFEFLCSLPKQLGKGYIRNIEVHPNLWVTISDYEYDDDVLIKIPDWDHPLQFGVLLSGKHVDEYGGQVGEGYTLISGSGVQRKMTIETPKSRIVSVNIHMPADLLATFFPTESGEIPPQLRLLAKGNDWQTLLYPQTNSAIQFVAQQIVSCPYRGMTKRMYLQAKVLELMALQLAPILTDWGGLQPSRRLKTPTIACIHHAKEILLSRLENPPSSVELATLVGVSDRTLRRGFIELFGTTVFRYLAVTSSTFVNGFRRYFGNRASDTANVEQLEILKGPASVLYGQGEPGGILNITTKQPLSTPYYAVDATIGSFDFYRPTLDISGLLNADGTIRYRLNAAYESSGSYVDFVESDQIFVAPIISFELGKNTTLTLEGEYFHVSKVEYLAGIPAVGSVIKSPFGEIPRSRYLDDPELDLDLDRVALGYRLQHKFSDNWSIRNGFRAELQNYEEGFVFAGSLQADNRTLNRSAGFDKFDSENYVLQTDVLGRIQTGTIKQDLLFGVDLARNDLIGDRFSIAIPAINIFNPNYSRPPFERIPTAYRNEIQNFIGVYAQDLISIGDNLKILLGGRFDYAEGSTNDQIPSRLPTEQEDSAFSPRVGIVYQPIQPVSLYASWTRSFQPSRPVLGNADGTPFKPTTGEQFEVGVKTEFLDGRLAATLAAYQLTKQNIVVTDPVNPRLNLQVGEQQSRGIEFDLAGQILPGWNIIASYSYIDSEFTEDPRPAFKGDEPSNVPRNSASLWTTYEIQTGSLKGLGFGAGLFFVGERQGDLPNTFALPSYVRADAAIYYRRNNLRVGLNFKNLSDVYYFESALSRTSVYPGAPFTVLGTVSFQF